MTIIREPRWIYTWDDTRRVRGVNQLYRNSALVHLELPIDHEGQLTDDQLDSAAAEMEARYNALYHQWQSRAYAVPGTRGQYVWPDGRVGSAVPELVAQARADIEAWRDRLDDAPLPLSGGDYAVASAQFEHWGGLFHRAQNHRADPAFPFRRVILPRVVASTGEPAGTHEVASVAELLSLVDARLERHNGAHNARHLVAEEYTPLIDAVEAAHAAAHWRVYDDATFTAPMDALLGYQLEARMRAEAEPLRQMPVAVAIGEAKAQAVHRLETEAAQRLTFLTGEPHTWLAVQQAATYDASGLVALVAEGRTAILAASSLEGVADAAREATALVKRWAFGLGVRLSHRVLARARAIRLVIMGAGPAHAAVSLHRDAPGPGTGTTPVPRGDYTVAPPGGELGESVTTLSVLVRLTDAVPADADLSLLVELRRTEDGPVALRQTEQVGPVPLPEQGVET